jgi:hypothetical protein
MVHRSKMHRFKEWWHLCFSMIQTLALIVMFTTLLAGYWIFFELPIQIYNLILGATFRRFR